MSDSVKNELNNNEVSIISHLLEIEKQASQIIAAENIRSDKKVADAKISADMEFKKKYALKAEELQKNFESEKQNIQKEHDEILSKYQASVTAMNQDAESFNEYLNSLLFSEN